MVKTTHKQPTTKKEIIFSILGDIKKDSEVSQECLSNDVFTETSQFVHDLISDPVRSILDTNNFIGNQAQETMAKLVIGYLKSRKDFLVKAFRKPNSLNFYLALKEDTFVIREQIFDDLDVLEGIDTSRKIKINFIFLPSSVQNNIPEVHEIIL